MHCLAKCLHVSTHNVYTLRDLYFTPADQCHFTVRFDSEILLPVVEKCHLYCMLLSYLS